MTTPGDATGSIISLATGPILSAAWLTDLVYQDLKGQLPPVSKAYNTGFPNVNNRDSTEKFTYTGHLTDMVLIRPSMPDVYPAFSEIAKAAQFWYNDARVQSSPLSDLLPRFVVQPGSTKLKRGEFQRVGQDIRLWAFLCAFKNIPVEKVHLVEKFKQACKQVTFDVTECTGDPVDDFFANWQVTLAYERVRARTAKQRGTWHNIHILHAQGTQSANNTE